MFVSAGGAEVWEREPFGFVELLFLGNDFEVFLTLSVGAGLSTHGDGKLLVKSE